MGSGLVGAGASLLHGLQGLGGVEEWGSVDLGDMRGSKKAREISAGATDSGNSVMARTS